ncbi:VCBS repeat-containing protein [Bradyrhizobium japonicum]
MATTPILINNINDLQAIQNNLSGYYVLGANIDAAGFSFASIGSAASPFTGIFDGQGHTISNLTIHNVINTDAGLFGDIGTTGTVSNVGLINESVTSSYSNVGGLVGTNFGTVSQSYVTGNVSGATLVGALVGFNGASGSIARAYATGTANGQIAGGLVGVNDGAISDSYATGSVNYFRVSLEAGGLVGLNGGSITQSYATGLVGLSGGFVFGGLVAVEVAGSVTVSYWDTETTGRSISGGGTGLTTAELQSGVLPAGFDPTVWSDIAGQFPELRWQVSNHPPVASNIFANANEDTNDPIVKLHALFTDADLSDNFTFTFDPTGTKGAVTNNGDGSFTYDPSGKFESLSVGDTATDTFTYTVTDNHGASSTATATVTIHGENDIPTPLPDFGHVQKGKTLNISAANGVLSNDSDVDQHDSLRVLKISGHEAYVGQTISGTYGSLKLNSDGSYVYTAGNKVGADTFVYAVNDGHGGTVESTLSIAVDAASASNKSLAFSISAFDADKNEGTNETTAFTFKVTLTGPITDTTKVDWSVAAGLTPSVDLSDFGLAAHKFPNGTVIFNPGDSPTKTISVPVFGDSLPENGGRPEDFVVTLSHPTAGASIDPFSSSAKGHIFDDDLIPFMAPLSQAAYYLNHFEVRGEGINNIDPSTAVLANGFLEPDQATVDAYNSISSALHLLPPGDLPTLVPHSSIDPKFPVTGLSDGIFTSGNSAALVARSSDSLYIAFRGTNDLDGDPNAVSIVEALSQHSSPDQNDWFLMPEHYQKFSALISALDAYIANPLNGIKHVYVSGHSLGAAMAQRYMLDHANDARFEAVTFADPDYVTLTGFGSVPQGADPRIINFHFENDPANFVRDHQTLVGPILGYSFGEAGDVFNLTTPTGAEHPHSMNLYDQVAQVFPAHNLLASGSFDTRLDVTHLDASHWLISA